EEIISLEVAPLKGREPAIISYSTTPTEKLSLLESNAKPRACSGDMWLRCQARHPDSCLSLLLLVRRTSSGLAAAPSALPAQSRALSHTHPAEQGSEKQLSRSLRQTDTTKQIGKARVRMQALKVWFHLDVDDIA